MHRQFQRVAVVFGLMCVAGCYGGPFSPYHMRETGARLSRCFNSPVCSHHRHRRHDQYAWPAHGTPCPSGNVCMPGTLCEPGPSCGPSVDACDCHPGANGVAGPCEAWEHGHGVYHQQAPGGNPLPGAPAESAAPAPAPDPVPDTLENHSAFETQGVRRTIWEEETDARVMLPGQQVSRSERRTTEYQPASVATESQSPDMQLPLIIPAQR